MINHDVHMNDVLFGMAESLFENTGAGKQVHLFTVNEASDKEIEVPQYNTRPPREIFYRKTVTYSTQLPPPVLSKRCTCLYMCTGANATIRCLSCANYDPQGIGYFCDLCFTSRHPWYRIPHIFFDIEKDENINHAVKIAHRSVEAERYEMEGKELLQRVQNNQSALIYVGDDEKVESNMLQIGRKMTSLEEKMREIRSRLRQDIRTSTAELNSKAGNGDGNDEDNRGGGSREGGSRKNKKGGGKNKSKIEKDYILEMSTDEAAPIMQKIIRGYLARVVVSVMVCQRHVRVWHSLGRDYYYDKHTGKASWAPPAMLMERHRDRMEYMGEDEEETKELKQNLKWCLKRNAPRHRPRSIVTLEDAQSVICGFLRCVRARQLVLQAANAVYRRVWDEKSMSYFYSHTVTRGGGGRGFSMTFWNKPTIYLITEPPLLYSNSNSTSHSTSTTTSTNKDGGNRNKNVFENNTEGRERERERERGGKRSPRVNRLDVIVN